MRKPEQTADPSIEEILSSIRRIIAEEGAQPPKAPDYSREMPSDAGDASTLEPRQDPYESRGGEQPEPFRQQSEDEILELTEDFMLEVAEPEEVAATPERQMPAQSREMEWTDQAAQYSAADLTSDPYASHDGYDAHAGLASVLSNVAAEVDRLASGESEATARAVPEQALDQVTQEEQELQSQDVAEPPRSFPPFMPLPGKDAASAQQTQPAADAQPEPPAAATRQQPAPSKPQGERPRVHSRPVWSARRLENETSARQSVEETGSEQRGAEHTASRPKNYGGRDRWEEGIQMEVPESGPEMPFPYASEAEAQSGLTPPAGTDMEASTAGKSGEELEDEKSLVGGFLNRVFGNSQVAEAAEAEGHEDAAHDLKGKAEELAKSTVSDFASEKLGAPGVANALYADKPFMDEIAGSLETALAEAEKSAGELEQVADAPANLADVEELPEELLPPESELPAEIPAEAVEAVSVPAAPDHHDQLEQALADRPHEPAPAPGHLSGGHPDPLFARPQEESTPAGVPAFRESARETAPPPVEAASIPAAGELPPGIEDSIKEMIKPLIVKWLNENLSRIVEQAVREELADRREEFPELRTNGKR